MRLESSDYGKLRATLAPQRGEGIDHATQRGSRGGDHARWLALVKAGIVKQGSDGVWRPTGLPVPAWVASKI